MLRFAAAPLHLERRSGGLALVRWLSAAAQLPPHIKITLPALSPTMTEGGIAKWKKQENDKIAPGEVLCEIETDKATVDFEYQEDGIIAKRLVTEGTSGLKVGTVIGIIVDDAANVAAFANTKFADFNEAAAAAPAPKAAKAESSSSENKENIKKQPEVPSAKPSSQSPAAKPAAKPASTTASRSGERVFASPFARRLAREQNKDISRISGTGPNGRVIAADVNEAKELGAQAAAEQAGDVSWTLNKLMTPHYYLNVDVDLSEANEVCEILNKSRKDKTPINVNEIILRAAALAMKTVPEANAAWGDGGSFRVYEFCDINVALTNPAGIVISPLIKSVHTSGLEEIALKLKELDEKMQKGEPIDETPGTFSVTNLGAFGVRGIVPIVRPGQSTALGVGAIRKTLVPGEGPTGGAKVTTIATATLSCDHRIVDGAIGAEWLHSFKKLIEKPMSMLL